MYLIHTWFWTSVLVIFTALSASGQQYSWINSSRNSTTEPTEPGQQQRGVAPTHAPSNRRRGFVPVDIPPPSSPEPVDMPTVGSGAASIIVMLQRISERITSLETLENQRTRKLDAIEYRLTKVELMLQEKSGEFHKVETQIERRMESLDWDASKMLTLLEVIREEIDRIKHSQIEIKVAVQNSLDQSEAPKSRDQPSRTLEILDSHLVGPESTARVQMILTTLYGLRQTVNNLHEDLSTIKNNVSSAANNSQTLLNNSRKLLTTKFFNEAMLQQADNKQTPVVEIVQCKQQKDDRELWPRDCVDVKDRGLNQSGVYQIKPQQAPGPIYVYCDMDTDGGGWTVLVKRLDGNINFQQLWNDYKNGFGNIGGEYWLGNDNIHWLTSQDVYELRFDLEDFYEQSAYATYSAFATGSGRESYLIKLLGTYEGTAGDSFSYHSAMKFSTADVDNDPWEGGNCAVTQTGGWWYSGCSTCNLNSQYMNGPVPDSLEYKSIYWYEWHGPSYGLKQADMKVRPASYRKRLAAAAAAGGKSKRGRARE